jgi:hypothetical protein
VKDRKKQRLSSQMFDVRDTDASCGGNGKRSIFPIFHRSNIEFGRPAREAALPEPILLPRFHMLRSWILLLNSAGFAR